MRTASMMAPDELQAHLTQQAANARATSEPADQPRSLDVATCSLPVSLVDDMIQQLEFYADYCVAGGEHPAADHAKKTARDLRARANAVRANVRQPRENADAEPTPKPPARNPEHL